MLGLQDVNAQSLQHILLKQTQLQQDDIHHSQVQQTPADMHQQQPAAADINLQELQIQQVTADHTADQVAQQASFAASASQLLQLKGSRSSSKCCCYSRPWPRNKRQQVRMQELADSARYAVHGNSGRVPALTCLSKLTADCPFILHAAHAAKLTPIGAISLSRHARVHLATVSKVCMPITSAFVCRVYTACLDNLPAQPSAGAQVGSNHTGSSRH